MTKTTSLAYKILAVPGFLVLFVFEQFMMLFVGRTTVFRAEDFPWTRRLEKDYPDIRRELAQVLNDDSYIPDFKELSVELADRITQGTSWKTYFLYAGGTPVEDNCVRCPATAESVKQIPGMVTAFFSILAPKTKITPHRGPYKGLLRYHLGLIVPDDRERCGIRIGREIRHWKVGESLIFDDTFNHEAWNDTDEVRVVLFVDFLRPLPRPLSTVNEFFVRRIAGSQLVKNLIANVGALKQKEAQRPT